MKKTRHNEEQIAFALKQAETGTAVAEVIRRMGSRSRRLFDGRRLRALTVVDAFTREALAIDVD